MTEAEMKYAYEQLIKKREYALEYRKKYVKENREKVNKQQRERYAKKKTEAGEIKENPEKLEESETT